MVSPVVPALTDHELELILMASLLGVLQACTVARVAGGAAVGAGRLALGAVDVVL